MAIRANRVKYRVLKFVTLLAAALAAAALFGVIFFILLRGLPHVNLQFLFGEYDVLEKKVSILPALVTTLYMIVTTLVLVIPLGVGAAVYLNEYTKPGSKIQRVISVAVDTLSGIPSIVFGLFGVMVFCQLFNLKLSILAASLTLTLINLPTVIRATQEALKTVPDAYREGSFALGAGKVRTIFKVVLPCALPGIVTSIILSIGRIIGESAAVLYTSGMSPINMPHSIFDPGANLAAAVYYFSLQDPASAAATGVVLLMLVVGLNFLAGYVGKKMQRKFES